MDQLITEGKIEKAKKVIDLAMTKMPVDYFGYYTLLEPFASGYYELGEKQKAQQLLAQLIKKYQEELLFFSGMSMSDQTFSKMDIITDIERYRSLLLIMKENGDDDSYNKARKEFNAYNAKFTRFNRDKE